MKNTNVLLVIIGVIAAGVGFFGGMKYQQTKQTPSQQSAGRFGGRGPGGQGSNGRGFRPVAGSIIAADDKSITVKLQDGSSKIVLVSDSTQINKAASATKSDLQVGQTVAVFGSENSDGSVTAQSVQLDPIMRNRQEGTPSGATKQ